MKRVRKISLLAVIRRVLLKWRFVVLIALIGAMIAGGMQVKKLWKYTREEVEKAEVIEAAKAAATVTPTPTPAATEEKSEEISAYEKALENLNDQITEKQNYMVNSLMSQIDFTNEDQATIEIYVNVQKAWDANKNAENITQLDSRISNTANAIMRSLQRAVSTQIDYTELSEDMGVEPALLKEMVFTGSADKSNHAFSLGARGRNAEEAEKIRDYVAEQILNYDWSSIADPKLYSIETYGADSYKYIDKSNFGWHKSRIAELNSLLSTRESYQTIIKKNRSNAAVATAVTTTTKKKTTIMSKKKILFSGVKHGMAGFVLGAAAGAVLAALWFVISGKVISAREFNSTYGFRKLAVFPEKDPAKLFWLDRLADRFNRDYRSASSDEVCGKIAAANLENIAPESRKTAILGDVSIDNLDKIVNTLTQFSAENHEFIAVHGLNENADALDLLEACDSVVVAAAAGKTSYNRTNDTLETVEVYNKNILGSIVL